MNFSKELTILIGSKNNGKIKEIINSLNGLDIKFVLASDYDINDPEETGNSFEENAKLKALYYSKTLIDMGISDFLCLADDSGLSIDALDGAPGIYSSRWAGKNRDCKLAIERVKKELESLNGNNNYQARFTCCLALYVPDCGVKIFSGSVKGKITFPPCGNNGFGYDPIFLPDGHSVTFGEMTQDFKDKISHRSIAINKLRSYILN